MSSSSAQKHAVEDADSYDGYISRRRAHSSHRDLRHRQRPSLKKAQQLENELEAKYQHESAKQEKRAEDQLRSQREEHKDLLKTLWSDPGINHETVHGLMIDAGSTGSRMHVYEWEPRILSEDADIADAVAGNKLSFPGTESRWTDRLQPGLSTFASLPDEQLKTAVADYLQPLLDFASTILHEKKKSFAEFPIFLRATAGMRILAPKDRSRVIRAVRDLFRNKTYCPFAFVDEQARVISGEEESIFDWCGVNFVSGDLLQQSQGAGTVVSPKQTVGALDLGGASTQISFYEPDEDIMSNLFKLQIGQAKHWNVYTHSFLLYGINEAINRFQARLVADKSTNERLVEGVYNPCLPGGSKMQIRSNIHLDSSGVETYNYTELYPSMNGYYQAILKNDNPTGDFELCMALTKGLLHLDKNDWCDFAHGGDCSFAGIYQPKLPTQSETVGSFVGFSNYYHIWKFLKLAENSTLDQLYTATKNVCSMSHDEVIDFTARRVDYDDIDSYCFRSTYAFQLLHSGYGFRMNGTIRVTKIINGHKIGWALGAMLYEINTMPWTHSPKAPIIQEAISEVSTGNMHWDGWFLFTTALGMLASLVYMLVIRRKENIARQHKYESLKDVEFQSQSH